MTEKQKNRNDKIHKIANWLNREFPGVKVGDAEAKRLLIFIEGLKIEPEGN